MNGNKAFRLLIVIALSALSACASSTSQSARFVSLPYPLSDGTIIQGWEFPPLGADGQFHGVVIRYSATSNPQRVARATIHSGQHFHGYTVSAITAHGETAGASSMGLAGIIVTEFTLRAPDPFHSLRLEDAAGAQRVYTDFQ